MQRLQFCENLRHRGNRVAAINRIARHAVLKNTFGEARYWLRPPGFAHPIDVEEVTSPDDMPETSYATRAKLTMQTPSDDAKWTQVNERVRVLKERKHLLVSNTGPKRDGYSYCVKCGRIEASSDPTPLLSAPHRKPYPDEKEPTCGGAGTTRHIVLGTDFITDIALFSMDVARTAATEAGALPHRCGTSHRQRSHGQSRQPDA